MLKYPPTNEMLTDPLTKASFGERLWKTSREMILLRV